MRRLTTLVSATALLAASSATVPGQDGEATEAETAIMNEMSELAEDNPEITEALDDLLADCRKFTDQVMRDGIAVPVDEARDLRDRARAMRDLIETQRDNLAESLFVVVPGLEAAIAEQGSLRRWRKLEDALEKPLQLLEELEQGGKLADKGILIRIMKLRFAEAALLRFGFTIPEIDRYLARVEAAGGRRVAVQEEDECVGTTHTVGGTGSTPRIGQGTAGEQPDGPGGKTQKADRSDPGSTSTDGGKKGGGTPEKKAAVPQPPSSNDTDDGEASAARSMVDPVLDGATFEWIRHHRPDLAARIERKAGELIDRSSWVPHQRLIAWLARLERNLDNSIAAAREFGTAEQVDQLILVKDHIRLLGFEFHGGVPPGYMTELQASDEREAEERIAAQAEDGMAEAPGSTSLDSGTGRSAESVPSGTDGAEDGGRNMEETDGEGDAPTFRSFLFFEGQHFFTSLREARPDIAAKLDRKFAELRTEARDIRDLAGKLARYVLRLAEELKVDIAAAEQFGTAERVKNLEKVRGQLHGIGARLNYRSTRFAELDDDETAQDAAGTDDAKRPTGKATQKVPESGTPDTGRKTSTSDKKAAAELKIAEADRTDLGLVKAKSTVLVLIDENGGPIENAQVKLLLPEPELPVAQATGTPPPADGQNAYAADVAGGSSGEDGLVRMAAAGAAAMGQPATANDAGGTLPSGNEIVIDRQPRKRAIVGYRVHYEPAAPVGSPGTVRAAVTEMGYRIADRLRIGDASLLLLSIPQAEFDAAKGALAGLDGVTFFEPDPCFEKERTVFRARATGRGKLDTSPVQTTRFRDSANM